MTREGGGEEEGRGKRANGRKEVVEAEWGGGGRTIYKYNWFF
jgi:hypothetical protein